MGELINKIGYVIAIGILILMAASVALLFMVGIYLYIASEIDFDISKSDKKLIFFITVAFTILHTVAIFPITFSFYYVILRFATFSLAFLIGAYAYGIKKKYISILFLPVILLFNPFHAPYFEKPTWDYLSLAAVLLGLLSLIIFMFHPTKEEKIN
ncbi:MAG: DUF6804 family protein [Candidatus Thorarchaeota archaeon]